MADSLKGISLGIFTEKLHALPEALESTQPSAIDVLERLGPDLSAQVQEEYGSRLNADRIRKLPRRYLEALGFEDICRIRARSMFSMSSSMEEMFGEDPRHTMFDRIRSSMWHWGSHRPTWNEYVMAYEGLRSFSVGLPDFEVRITWTNTYCDGQQSDHCDTWLDGHFAYLIHYRGVHVITLGFSLAGEGRLLLQQVQLASPRGNRWLFRIPGNRMEFAIELFARAFPSHEILVVDGVDLARRNIAGYSHTLRKVQERVQNLRRQREKDDACDSVRMRFNRAVIEEEQLVEKIEALEQDTSRLASLYGDCGRFRRGEPQVVNRMTHYALAA